MDDFKNSSNSGKEIENSFDMSESEKFENNAAADEVSNIQKEANETVAEQQNNETIEIREDQQEPTNDVSDDLIIIQSCYGHYTDY